MIYPAGFDALYLDFDVLLVRDPVPSLVEARGVYVYIYIYMYIYIYIYAYNTYIHAYTHTRCYDIPYHTII